MKFIHTTIINKIKIIATNITGGYFITRYNPVIIKDSPII